MTWMGLGAVIVAVLWVGWLVWEIEGYLRTRRGPYDHDAINRARRRMRP